VHVLTTLLYALQSLQDHFLVFDAPCAIGGTTHVGEIAGGVVAVVLLIIIMVVVVVALVMRSHHGVLKTEE